MKILFKLFIIGLVVFTVGSCRTNKFKRELAQIDSLETVLKKCEQVLAIDPEKVQKRVEEINADLAYIKENNTDTFTAEIAFMLDEYYAMAKTYKKYLKKYSDFEQEYQELMTQVQNLKAGLLNGNITQQQFVSYYQKEKEDVNRLHSLLDIYAQPLFDIERSYGRIKEKVGEYKKEISRKSPTSKTKS